MPDREHPISDMMTSELVYYSSDIADEFCLEYHRRLQSLDLSSDQITAAYQREKEVLVRRTEQHHGLWATRYFITVASTRENMPAIEDLTFSEMIVITDDANSGYVRDHHVLPDAAWSALCMAAAASACCEAKYAYAFRDTVMKEYGWTEAQQAAYIRNECMLTERLKWGMHNNPAWSN